MKWLMFSATPRSGTLTFWNMSPPLIATRVAAGCGVVTMSAPSRGRVCTSERYDGVANQAVVFEGAAQRGDAVGADTSAQTWAGRWAERVHRRDDVAGQRRDEESGAARYGAELRRLLTAVGASRRHRKPHERTVSAAGP